MPQFEVIKGQNQKDGEVSPEELKKQLSELADKYSTHIGLHPRWSVWGHGPGMGAGILYWIKPGEADEFVARQMSQIINKLGGEARAEMTEWNENLTGKPVYKRKGGLNYIMDNK